MKEQRYIFNQIEKCNMCGDLATNVKILGQRLNRSQGFDPKSKTGIAVSVVRCNNCGLVYPNPQPVPENIQDHYGIPPEHYWKEEYFTYDESYFSYEIALAKKLLPFSEGMSALDIGAGLGKCMISLERAGFDTFGLEPSVTFREKAIDKMNLDANKIKLGMMEEVDYPESSFDFITFGAVLEHLYDPKACIERAFRWLKPNGVIQIEVPSSNWLITRLFNFYFKLRGTNYVTNLSPMHEPFHMYEFSLISFENLAKRSGFSIAHHEYYVCSVYHIPTLLHPPLKWYMKQTNSGMQLAVWLRKNK